MPKPRRRKESSPGALSPLASLCPNFSFFFLGETFAMCKGYNPINSDHLSATDFYLGKSKHKRLVPQDLYGSRQNKNTQETEEEQMKSRGRCPLDPHDDLQRQRRTSARQDCRRRSSTEQNDRRKRKAHLFVDAVDAMPPRSPRRARQSSRASGRTTSGFSLIEGHSRRPGDDLQGHQTVEKQVRTYRGTSSRRRSGHVDARLQSGNGPQVF